MQTLFELLFEILGELAIEFLVQTAFEFGLRALLAPFQRLAAALGNPWLALAGAMAGAASLLVAGEAWIGSPTLRLVNLIVSPLVAGAAFALLGAFRARRGLVVLPFDRFRGGFSFAFAFTLVRFCFAH